MNVEGILNTWDAEREAHKAEVDRLREALDAIAGTFDVKCSKLRAMARNAIDAKPQQYRTLSHLTGENKALRDALTEITNDPYADASGNDRGCLDLHEARTIARDALAYSDAENETERRT